jgi:hypothetical protein
LRHALGRRDIRDVEIGAVQQRRPETFGADARGKAAVEIFTAERQGPVAPNAVARLALVGIANAGEEAEPVRDVIGSVNVESIALALDVGHYELGRRIAAKAAVGEREIAHRLIFLEIECPKVPAEALIVVREQARFIDLAFRTGLPEIPRIIVILDCRQIAARIIDTVT